MNFIKITEQPSIHEDLEQKSVRELLEGINEEDRKVASAVHACIPQIEKLVNEIVERMHQGGRIFYLGAGTSGRLGVLDASEIPPTFGMPDTCVIGIIAGGEQALPPGAHGGDAQRHQRLADHRRLPVRAHQHGDVARLHRLALDRGGAGARLDEHAVDVRHAGLGGQLS